MDHHHHEHKEGDGGLRLAFFLNVVFAVIELVGGLWTNSIAIVSDAVHDFGDSLSIAFAWTMNRLSARRSSETLTFGYRRYRLLGALVTGLVLLGGSVFILTEAIPRLFAPEAVEPRGMLPLALLGIAVNGVAAFRLRGNTDANRRVVTLHLMEDILGWVAVLVVSIVLFFVDLPILDPILSVGITLFILSRILPSLRRVLRVFLQHAPAGVPTSELRGALEDLEGVAEVHHVHVWTLDGEYNLLSAHLVMEGNPPLDALEETKASAKERLGEKGIQHVTLEFEAQQAGCRDCDL
ncbi:MAG: cation diffusion facilitator family transporter [Spirochaetota bacterium]